MDERELAQFRQRLDEYNRAALAQEQAERAARAPKVYIEDERNGCVYLVVNDKLVPANRPPQWPARGTKGAGQNFYRKLGAALAQVGVCSADDLRWMCCAHDGGAYVVVAQIRENG
jgi:hypothetical protein